MSQDRQEAAELRNIVRELKDREQIRELAYRYAHTFDRRDVVGFLDLWAEADEPAEAPLINGANFRGSIDRFFRAGAASILFVGNHIIDVTGPDQATGEVYCWAQTEREIAGQTRWVSQMVLYQDDYVRSADQRWRFKQRRHLLWFGDLAERNPRQQDPVDWPSGHTGSPFFGRGSLPEGFAPYRQFWNLAPGESLDGAPIAEGDAR